MVVCFSIIEKITDSFPVLFLLLLIAEHSFIYLHEKHVTLIVLLEIQHHKSLNLKFIKILLSLSPILDLVKISTAALLTYSLNNHFDNRIM